MIAEIDALDRALARAGQRITLRRLPNIEVDCLATVRGYMPQELVPGNGITQQDSKVIISPTPINAAGWPGTQVPGQPDIRVSSRNRGDLCIINGVQRTVQAGVGIYLPDNTLVRIELQVR